MFKKLLFISLLALLPILIFTPLIAQGQGTYPVQGVVFDDRNGNGVQDGGEPGIPGKLIYADNTNSYQVRSNVDGSFRLDVPEGTHSIEIQNAGEAGGMPTTAQKIPVNGSQGGLRFGVQHQGYDLVGVVRDSRGNPVQGVEVYLDNGYYRAVTDNRGVYRIENVTYDASQVIPGVQGGHNAYVRGYEDFVRDRSYVNPQQPLTRSDQFDTVGVRSFTLPGFVGTQPPSTGFCTPGAVVSSGGTTCRNQEYCEVNNVCNSDGRTTSQQFNCSLRVGSCGYNGTGTPFPGQQQCTPNSVAGASFTGCSGDQRQCTMTPYWGNDCRSTYNAASNCQPLTNGVCGYTGPSQSLNPNPITVDPFTSNTTLPPYGSSQLMGQGFQDPFFQDFWSQQPQQTQQLFSAPAPVSSPVQAEDDIWRSIGPFEGQNSGWWDGGDNRQLMQDSFNGSFNDTWSQMDTSFEQSFPGFDWSY